jgi:hypothetical protein
VFTPLALGSIKVASNWRGIDSAYVKVSGVWRRIVTGWTKVDGVWKELTTTVSKTFPTFASNADSFGVAGRAPTGSEGYGGGGGGGKIICTKLYHLGRLGKDVYEADQEFGQWLLANNPDVYNGYRAWAEIVVDWMEAKGPNIMPWIRDPELRMHRLVTWSTNWAEEIATPWAEEIAYRAGKRSTGNVTGRLLMMIGVPVSKAVGIWQRVFGRSKKPAGFIKGTLLVGVFCALKGIVIASNYLQQRKHKEQIA